MGETESVPAPPAPTSPDDVEARVSIAWRELRRGASMLRVRSLLLGSGADAIDLGQLDTLDLLVRRGGLRMSELADALRIDNSSATRAVSRLVESGLARREASPGDARGVFVSPTDSGVERYKKISARWGAAMREMLLEFDPVEQHELASLLERLVVALDRFADRGVSLSPDWITG